MTPAQLAALKADIQGNPTLTALWAAGERGQVAAYYSQPASPDFYVWRTSMTAAEMHGAYVWTEMDNFTNAAKQFQFNLMISQGSVNPSSANVRQGFLDIFAGAQFANTRAALVALAKRKANNTEKLFSTGGTGAVNDPGTMGFEGAASITDVELAMAS